MNAIELGVIPPLTKANPYGWQAILYAEWVDRYAEDLCQEQFLIGYLAGLPA